MSHYVKAKYPKRMKDHDLWLHLFSPASNASKFSCLSGWVDVRSGLERGKVGQWIEKYLQAGLQI
jgi:hypothetical protein